MSLSHISPHDPSPLKQDPMSDVNMFFNVNIFFFHVVLTKAHVALSNLRNACFVMSAFTGRGPLSSKKSDCDQHKTNMFVFPIRHLEWFVMHYEYFLVWFTARANYVLR